MRPSRAADRPTRPGGAAERRLAARILDAVLREDYGSVRRFVGTDGAAGTQVLRVPGHPVVRLRGRADPAPGLGQDSEQEQGPDRGAGPVREPGPVPEHGAARHHVGEPFDTETGSYPGFLSEWVVVPGPTLDEALAIVRAVGDPRDAVADFVQEARHALRTAALHERIRPEVFSRLRAVDRRGPGAYYETLAAFSDHPVYPTGRSRIGMSLADLRRYAPESAPRFPLRWVAVPRGEVTARGTRPDWWPGPTDVGLGPEFAATHDLFPVHPLTARKPVARSSAAPKAFLEVTPTLSVRTVVAGREHLKLPLPVSTLGLRNRRLIVPRTLADGASVQRLLSRIAGADDRILLADEQTYAHAGDPLLGFLVRRFPAEVFDADVVPVAALLARAPGGGHVIEAWEVEPLFDTYLQALFAWNVLLFVRYGIALEAHQQNVSLVLGGSGGGDPPHLRLLLKDNDAALIDLDRLTAALGRETAPLRLEDQRLITNDQEALARVFVTITLHLCAGALAFGLAERGLLPLPTGLGLIRDRLDEALSRFGREAAFLRSRTIDADRLPTKAMVTAGTLVDKARTGAHDINKHYGPSGPNYLRDRLCS